MATTTLADKYSFVSEPDDALRCLICLQVADDPKQHEKCGRLFCMECLERHGYTKPCPYCRAEQPQYFVDTRGKSLGSDKMKLSVCMCMLWQS